MGRRSKARPWGVGANPERPRVCGPQVLLSLNIATQQITRRRSTEEVLALGLGLGAQRCRPLAGVAGAARPKPQGSHGARGQDAALGVGAKSRAPPQGAFSAPKTPSRPPPAAPHCAQRAFGRAAQGQMEESDQIQAHTRGGAGDRRAHAAGPMVKNALLGPVCMCGLRAGRGGRRSHDGQDQGRR